MFTLLQRWYQRHFSQPGTIEFALVLIVSFIIVYYFMWLVGPIVVALCFAFCLDWPVVAMQHRFALSRKIGSIIVMLVFSSLLTLTTIWLVPNVVKQGAEFYNSIVAFSMDDGSHKNKNHNEVTGATTVSSNKELVFDESSISPKINKPLASGSLSGVLAHNDPKHLESANSARSAISTAGSAAGNPASSASGSAAGDALASNKSDSQIGKDKAEAVAKAEDKAGATAGAGATAEAKAEDGDDKQSAKSTNRETTIVYIAPTHNDNNSHNLSSNEQMAKAVANAAMVAAEIEQAKKKEQPSTAVSDKDSNEGPDYHITLINGAGNISLDSNDVNQFTMTTNDFDNRLAKELYDVVLSMPEPLPSMLPLSLIKNSIRTARVAATNKMADVMRTQLMPSVVNAFTWLVYALIVPIFTFLMLYNKELLQNRAKIFILPNNQQLMRKFWPSMHAQIAGYIRGKLIHITIIAIANTLAFMLLDMNYALLLGVGVGLSVVIPYVGAVIIAVPVVMVAIIQFGFSSTLIWVLIIYTIIQLLDSNILTPMLFSKAMNLDAFSILAAILIFGNLWGFWGVFFAIPLATFVKTLIVGWPNADPIKPDEQRI